MFLLYWISYILCPKGSEGVVMMFGKTGAVSDTIHSIVKKHITRTLQINLCHLQLSHKYLYVTVRKVPIRNLSMCQISSLHEEYDNKKMWR